MDNKDNFVTKTKDALENSNIARIDEISSRECKGKGSKTGVEVTIIGFIVPIMPIIQVASNIDNFVIKDIGMYGDTKTNNDNSDECHYGVVVYCEYQDNNSYNDAF